jgi:hypothetical protein
MAAFYFKWIVAMAGFTPALAGKDDGRKAAC